jgi:pimeloyl-ACP methyl ester carboxylesterase
LANVVEGGARRGTGRGVALGLRFSTGLIVKAGGFEQLGQTAFLNDFAGGVPRVRALALYAAQGPVSTSLFTDKTTVAAWRTKPTWYAVSKQDRTIAPELERFLAQRMKATTVELNSSHLSMVTQPGAITKLILDAAKNHSGVLGGTRPGLRAPALGRRRMPDQLSRAAQGVRYCD